jgi:hypothetical protein
MKAQDEKTIAGMRALKESLEGRMEKITADPGEIEAWQRETADMIKTAIESMSERFESAVAGLTEAVTKEEEPEEPPAKKTIIVKKQADGSFKAEVTHEGKED